MALVCSARRRKLRNYLPASARLAATSLTRTSWPASLGCSPARKLARPGNKLLANYEAAERLQLCFAARSQRIVRSKLRGAGERGLSLSLSLLCAALAAYALLCIPPFATQALPICSSASDLIGGARQSSLVGCITLQRQWRPNERSLIADRPSRVASKPHGSADGSRIRCQRVAS